MNARQQSILQMVIDKGRMSVADLAKMTGVSEVTIRQDLNLLEKQSYLRRTHGFAVPLDSEDVETRMMTHFSIKRELATRAAELVNAGETVFIENGSCNALLARTLAERGDITIITVSSYIAHLLKETPGRSFCSAESTRSAAKVWSARSRGSLFSRSTSAKHLLASMAGSRKPGLPAGI